MNQVQNIIQAYQEQPVNQIHNIIQACQEQPVNQVQHIIQTSYDSLHLTYYINGVIFDI